MKIDAQRLTDEAYRRRLFDALLERYQHAVFGFCVKRLGDLYGENVAQEVFVTAWEKLTGVDPGGDWAIDSERVARWLFAIASNKCRQTLRNRGRRRVLAQRYLQDIRDNVHGHHAAPPDQPPQTELAERLAAGLQRLSVNDRLLIKLRYSQGQAVADIADLFDINEVTARKRLSRALQALRRSIADEPD